MFKEMYAMWKKMALLTLLVISGCTPAITYKTEYTPWNDVVAKVIDENHVQIAVFDKDAAKFKKQIILLKNSQSSGEILIQQREKFIVKCENNHCEPLPSEFEYRLK